MIPNRALLAQLLAVAMQLSSSSAAALPKEEHHLQKRVNFGFATKLLEGNGPISAAACAPIVPAKIKAAACSMAIVGEIGLAVYKEYKSIQSSSKLKSRTSVRINALADTILVVPDVEGQSTVVTLMSLYEGNNKTAPVLVSYDDCFGPGCFEMYYQNARDSAHRLVHQTSVAPRLDLNDLQKRQHDDAGTSDNLYGDYYWQDAVSDAEVGLSYTFNQDGFQGEFEDAVDIDEFTTLGIHCFNVYESDHATLASTGYLALAQGAPYGTDGGNDYLAQCQGFGVGK